MSVELATEERPVPPEIVSVSIPDVIVWLVPESPATVKDVATLEILELIFATKSST